MQLSLTSFRFDVNGLQLDYTLDGENGSLSFDPRATCQLFKENSLIEDFDSDRNGDPVILFCDGTYPEGYGFDRWNSFVCFFPVNFRTAQLLIEAKFQGQQTRRDLARVSYLLSPLGRA
jgi:hypothetical protein